MHAFSSHAVDEVVGNRVWVSDAYVDYCLSGEATQRFQYFQHGQFFGRDEPITLSELVQQEIYPVCREARAAALIEAYQDNNECLVLMQRIQGLMQGVVFHPSTTVPGHIQASCFNEHGFVDHTTHETLFAAVFEHADYQCDGKAFIEVVFSARATRQ